MLIIQFEFSISTISLIIQSLCYFHYLFDQFYSDLETQFKALLQSNSTEVYHHREFLRFNLHQILLYSLCKWEKQIIH